jgi:signal transduction histidine kinase
MRKILGSLMMSMALFCVNAFAAERGTAEEAVAMVKKVVSYLKANGKEKTFAEVNNPNGQFVKGDLYVFVHDLDGLCVAHGGNPKLIGKNLLDLKDATGFQMVRGFIDVANTKGKGWVDYKWPNKTTKEVENKSTYLEKADNLIISVGIYKS